MCAPAAFVALGASATTASTLAALSTAAIGIGTTLYGQQQAQSAQDDYNNKQEALQNQQKQLALQQQAKEDELWKEKSANIVDEASKVTAAESRQQAMQQAEEAATASNVKALEAANALGDASVGKSAEGAQSDAYLNARAKAASEQTDRAIGLARLFGKQGAIGDAMQNQGISAMDNMLKSQGLDFQNRQQRRGFEGSVDLLGKQSNSVKFDSSAGQTAQSLGGLFTSAGMNGIGQEWGQNNGFKAFQNKGQ